MKSFNILTTDLAQTSSGIMGHQFISIQLSYSTADIEKNLFYTFVQMPLEPSEPPGKATVLIVHGNMFALEEEEPIPEPSTPLTEESGLFKIVGLANQFQS